MNLMERSSFPDHLVNLIERSSFPEHLVVRVHTELPRDSGRPHFVQTTFEDRVYVTVEDVKTWLEKAPAVTASAFADRFERY